MERTFHAEDSCGRVPLNRPYAAMALRCEKKAAPVAAVGGPRSLDAATSHALLVCVPLVSRAAVFGEAVGARPFVSLKLVVIDNCALSGE